MDYAKFAISLWIVATIATVILGKKSFFKVLEVTQNKFVKVDWRAYLLCAAGIGAAVSIGITFLVKSFS